MFLIRLEMQRSPAIHNRNIVVKDTTHSRDYALHSTLSRKYLDNPVAAGRNHKPAVLTPDYAADSFAAHDAVGGDFLRADALVERPEPDRGVVACRYGFATVFAKGERRYGGWVGKHAVSALT
jgi:hypothetical protein